MRVGVQLFWVREPLSLRPPGCGAVCSGSPCSPPCNPQGVLLAVQTVLLPACTAGGTHHALVVGIVQLLAVLGGQLRKAVERKFDVPASSTLS